MNNLLLYNTMSDFNVAEDPAGYVDSIVPGVAYVPEGDGSVFYNPIPINYTIELYNIYGNLECTINKSSLKFDPAHESPEGTSQTYYYIWIGQYTSSGYCKHGWDFNGESATYVDHLEDWEGNTIPLTSPQDCEEPEPYVVYFKESVDGQTIKIYDRGVSNY